MRLSTAACCASFWPKYALYGRTLLAVAARVGRARLIDNVILGDQ